MIVSNFSSLRKREFILGYGSGGIESILVGKACYQEQEAARSHFIHKQEGEREKQEIEQSYKSCHGVLFPARLHLLKVP